MAKLRTATPGAGVVVVSGGELNVTGLVVIAICLVLSAFFSSAETAITSLGHVKIRHLIEMRGKRTSHLQIWLHKPNFVLSTILIGNTVVNILASAIATKVGSDYFHEQAIGIATGILTLLILIFGEIIPKTFGKVFSETWGDISLRIIRVCILVFYPIIWASAAFADKVLNLFTRSHDQAPAITEEEIEFMVNLGEETGAIDDVKSEMLTSVFEFDETKVKEIMTPRLEVSAISEKATIGQVLDVVVDTGHSRIPVYRDTIDQVVGIVLAKDLLRSIAKNVDRSSNLESITREPFFVPESKQINEVFKELNRSKTHLAIVVDEHGGTAGIVTMEDMVEEVFGEIQDEFDLEEVKILEVLPGRYEVAGSVSVDEFIDYFEIENDERLSKPDSDIDTVGGWMRHLLGGGVPRVGQSRSIGPLSLKVIEVDRHRIKRLRVKKPRPKVADDSVSSS